MERWMETVAVVTGASSGIGAAICKMLVRKGLKVVGMARRLEKIEELSESLEGEEGKLVALKCDVSNEEDIVTAFQWIAENVGPVGILINNAGVVRPTTLIDGDSEEWRKVFDVNVIGLCICTREALKSMIANKISGQIIHMNSIVGHYVPNMGTPNSNVYAASKYAVTALTESMRQELRYNQLDIKVTSISPGVVTSELREGFPDDGTREILAQVPNLNPEDIAEAVLYVLSTGPKVHKRNTGSQYPDASLLHFPAVTGTFAVAMFRHLADEAQEQETSTFPLLNSQLTSVEEYIRYLKFSDCSNNVNHINIIHMYFFLN